MLRRFSNSGLLRSVMKIPSRLAFMIPVKKARQALLSRPWTTWSSVPVMGDWRTAKMRESRGKRSMSIVSKALDCDVSKIEKCDSP